MVEVAVGYYEERNLRELECNKVCCSGLMISDTKLGGKVSTVNEVFDDKTTAMYIFF